LAATAEVSYWRMRRYRKGSGGVLVQRGGCGGSVSTVRIDGGGGGAQVGVALAAKAVFRLRASLRRRYRGMPRRGSCPRELQLRRGWRLWQQPRSCSCSRGRTYSPGQLLRSQKHDKAGAAVTQAGDGGSGGGGVHDNSPFGDLGRWGGGSGDSSAICNAPGGDLNYGPLARG
jgi:hypothetical protein